VISLQKRSGQRSRRKAARQVKGGKYFKKRGSCSQYKMLIEANRLGAEEVSIGFIT